MLLAGQPISFLDPFQANTVVKDELRSEASDLREIQSGIESTINPQLVRSLCFLSVLLLTATVSF